MPISRRGFVGLAAGAVAAGVVASSSVVRAAPKSRIKCVAFDAFPVFDPRPIGAMAEQLFPTMGGELLKLWRTRQFEYTWLRSMSGRYADFWKVSNDSLVFSARAMKLELSEVNREQLLKALLNLKAYPDVLPALTSLRNAGLRLGFVSNFTPAMLSANIAGAKLDGMFEQVLSTDSVKVFKPAPAAYQMAMDAFGVQRDEVLFVPFAAWDAAGAKWFGYETFWVNRMGLPLEALDAEPDGTGANLADLVKYLNV